MGKIKILSPHEVQKIAAGEVVERPANVVKELLENALDAGAKNITLFVHEGGKRGIKIVDDGSGMSREDARACIENHATSKISGVDDLSTIATFGFRGEALASMAAVSKLRIVTKESGSAEGIALDIADARIVQEQMVACNQGTEITVADVFYNVPARQKFLKKRETEWNAIVQTIHACALMFIDCAFTVYHDDKKVLYAPRAQSTIERAGQLFGTELLDVAHDINSTEAADGVITGFCCDSRKTRYDRSHIFLFVNNRWVKNQKIVASFIKGYDNIMFPGQYPIGCVMLRVDPGSIDVNIHPRKEEVQFLHPRRIEIMVEDAVRATLMQYAKKSLQVTQNLNSYGGTSPRPVWGNYTASVSVAQSPEGSEASSVAFRPSGQSMVQGGLSSSTQNSGTLESAYRPEQNFSVAEASEHKGYRLLGQVHKTYIAIENDQGILFIDQHAAHERILFEKFLSRSVENESTRLLFPQVLTVNDREGALLDEYVVVLQAAGIGIDRFSENKFSITSVPTALAREDSVTMVREFIAGFENEQLSDAQAVRQKMHEHICALMACKAAVKAGDVLSDQEMHRLIGAMPQTAHCTTCPHGRPTSWMVTLRDFEKQFQRVM